MADAGVSPIMSIDNPKLQPPSEVSQSIKMSGKKRLLQHRSVSSAAKVGKRHKNQKKDNETVAMIKTYEDDSTLHYLRVLDIDTFIRRELKLEKKITTPMQYI